MFFLKKNYFPRSKILIGYVDNHYHYVKQSNRFLDVLKAYYCINCTSNHAFKKKDNLNVQRKQSLSHFSTCNGKCSSTNTVPKNPNIFGDLSHEKYERVSMDEAEEKDEKFSERVIVPRKHRFTYKDYCNLIKSHMLRKDLKLALSVLDLMKENGDKPNRYIYRLLLSASAAQGDVKQCFKLFTSMRNRGIDPSPPVYNSLINACSETNDTDLALKNLAYLREYFYERHIHLNELHYITFIKAYSHHKQILTAFQLADEAVDKGYDLSNIFTILFHVAINDKKNGLKLALILWHKMKMNKIKPNICQYNLLLRAIGETELGDLKINDTLIPGAVATQIQVTEVERPDLLDSPPVLSRSLISLFNTEHNSKHYNDHSNNNSSKLNVVSESNPLSINLNDVLKENRLILFGGIDKLLKRMQDDGVVIDTKSLTLIVQLLPPTIKAEEHFLRYIKQHNIPTDIAFYNILIKRRSIRQQYEYAKDVLNEIQRHHLTPDIITFGVLALGCIKYQDGIELLNQMDTIGYAPNYIILHSLIRNACYLKNFHYLLHLMDYMKENQIKPTNIILETIEKFDDLTLQYLDGKGKYSSKEINIVQRRYNVFKLKYENWKEQMLKDVNMSN
ncbi:pentatricopeptide repeat-containing protein 1, mitochondrial [Xylocopa sonorina]|uniref:pentatricopeptide repeat-containing protein 1, mitochondrial n=1 Tax=Xylocopa sonorina TaxID=1818115 RepID=UPI00403AD5B1